jgi:transposase
VDYAAIDLHKKESQIRIVTEAGEVIDRRIRTTREALATLFGGRPRLRVLVEASTESEWVAEHLEGLGHEVIVADPNYAPMYGHRHRRVKTDLRDTAALTEACRQGSYRAVHRRSAAQRTVQAQLTVRQALITTRTRLISLARALTRGVGARIASGHADTFRERLARVELPAGVRSVLAPIVALLTTVDAELATADAQVTAQSAGDPAVARLMTMPTIGAVTATAVVAAVDTPTRFASAAHVTSYVGLVPCEASSGERQHRGHVGRSAQPYLRALLVQAAWRVWRSTRSDLGDLRAWARQVADRRGKRIAIVALARRLMRILFAMWRDEQPFHAPTRALLVAAP